MSDLDIARTRLFKEELTLSIVKNGKILFETDSHRISGFLRAIDKLGTKLEDASVADRVVGKAIALLCVYVRINNVYAEVLSRNAKTVFEKNKISHKWSIIVDNILDLNRCGICLFEKAAREISNPEKAYMVFKKLLKSFKSSN
jgi:hypothetical protein